MNWKKIILIIAGITLVALVVWQLKSNKGIAENRVYHYDKEQPINVKTQVIKNEAITNNLSYPGRFEANKETKVSAETQGKVIKITVEEGDFVKKGQTLIQLDNALLKMQLQKVNVQIEGLEADLKRYTILSESDAIQGVKLEKTTLALKSAVIQKATIQEQINKSTIKAPFDGIVTMKFTELGAFAAPGIPLIQITDLSVLKFTITVPESMLNDFQINESYVIIADIYPDLPLKGTASLIASKVNKANSFTIQFTIKNTEETNIKSGIFGKVINTNGSSIKKGFLVPSSAIIGNTDQPQLYIVKDGKAQIQNISIANRIQNKTVVSEGLNEGDIIITNGLINLFDGANVTFN